jgi:hypothetical protein
MKARLRLLAPCCLAPTCLVAPPALAAAALTVTKSVSVVADRVNTVAFKALPGATVEETVLVVSPLGNATAAIAAVGVVDTLPAAVKLRVVDLGAAGSGPVSFADGDVLGLGLLGSGLTFRFVSLASGTDGVDFSSDGVTWTYVPSADADGCDANVRAIRVRLSGSQVAGSGFRLRYRVVIR